VSGIRFMPAKASHFSIAEYTSYDAVHAAATGEIRLKLQ